MLLVVTTVNEQLPILYTFYEIKKHTVSEIYIKLVFLNRLLYKIEFNHQAYI